MVTDKIFDWWERNADFFSTLLAIIFIIGILTALVVFVLPEVNDSLCTTQTRDIGFSSRYNQGCQIEVLPGKWIPLENYCFKQE